MKIIDKVDGTAPRSTVRSIIKAMTVMFKPRDAREVTEIVGDVFKLPEGGSFDISLVPYLRQPLNWLKDRDTHMIVYVSPARAGKTVTLVIGGVTYVLTEDPSDCLIVHITDTTAKKFSKLSIARTFQNSPKIKALMQSSKDSNNILAKFLRNGAALIIGYPAPSQLAATDYKYVFITDSDRSPDDNGQGDWIKQADKRTQTFGTAGKTVLESSPSRDIIDPDWKRTTRHEAPPVAGIMAWYNMGDRRIEYWECPHCWEMFPLYPDYSLFHLPDRDDLLKELIKNGTADTAKKYDKIWCPNNGCCIEPEHKSTMGEKHQWYPEFPEAPNNRIKSYWGSGYSAGFQTWRAILTEYFLALVYWSETGDESKLRVTYNLDMGAPYTSMSMNSKLTSNELRERAYDFGNKVVPQGVRYLIANIDSQKWKWVVDIQGIGVNNERWIIDRFDVQTSSRQTPKTNESDDISFELVQPATYVEDWDILTEQVLRRTYPLDDGSKREMKIHHTVCDMQGLDGVTENAYKYAKKLKYDLGLGDQLTLLRGERPNPRTNQPLVTLSRLDKTSRAAILARVVGKLSFARVNTTIAKDVLAGQLRRTEKGANYIHFSTFLDDSVFDECVVEVRTPSGWGNPLGRRNEQWDLLAYGLANLKLIEFKQFNQQFLWANPPSFAAEWDNNTNIIAYKGFDLKKIENKQSDRDKIARSRQQRR